MTDKQFNIEQFQANYLRGTKIDIFDDFDSEVHPVKFFMHKYNELCFTYKITTDLNIPDFLKKLREHKHLQDEQFILRDEMGKDKKPREVDYEYAYYLIQMDDKLLLEVNQYKLSFYYSKHVPFSKIEEIIELIVENKKEQSLSDKFFMIAASKQSEFGFELKRFNVKSQQIDLDKNYNDDFKPVNETIVNFLQKANATGMVLLHGKYGTGKTTYLRHLMGNVNQRFIFLPINLAGALSDPNFLPFISQYKDSILVLEDSEDLISDRKNKGGSSLSLTNLLNIGDGLLSDALNIKIICTFNANISDIDPAILRKGRLVARYEFKPLSVDKVKALSKELGLNGKLNQPMTLAEIYNQDTNDYSPDEKKIGFS